MFLILYYMQVNKIKDLIMLTVSVHEKIELLINCLKKIKLYHGDQTILINVL